MFLYPHHILRTGKSITYRYLDALLMNGIVAILLFSCLVLPHGDLEQRILEKTNQIALNPFKAELYLERGELYNLHEEYSRARSDFSFCISHQHFSASVYLGMSTSLLYLNKPDSALIFVDQLLATEGNHLSALELKGTILFRLEKYCDAARVLEKLISNAQNPSPSLFLKTSENWELCNEEENQLRAIDVLKQGLKRTGDISSLQKQLILIFKKSGQYQEAIRIHTYMIDHSNLKIKPYYERALLYAELQTKDLAIEDLNKALVHLEQLPPHKKSIPSIISMGHQIRDLLTQLKK